MSDYGDWPREKLIEHIQAYGLGLHQLGGRCMKQEREIRKLRERLDYIDKTRDFFHGA